MDSLSLAIRYTNHLKEICSPFFNDTPVNSFTYSRVYPDGSRTELWSNPYALEHSFIKKKYISQIYTPDLYQAEERYVFLPSKIQILAPHVKDRYSQQLHDQKEIFDHDNCFLVLNKTHDLCEYFIFYTSQRCKQGVNFYFNHLNKIEGFIYQFKNSSKNIIRIIDQHRIIKAWREKTNPGKSICGSISPSIILTTREIQTAKLLLEGKTAKESALALGLSVRTIESYIDNIKNKTGTNRKTDLILKLLNLRIYYE